jgi:hypothetical protein
MYPTGRAKVTPLNRKPTELDEQAQLIEAALDALRIFPVERTHGHIDAILAVIGKWQSFTAIAQTDPHRREICRSMFLESGRPSTVIYKVDDPSRDWYLILSGQCSTYTIAPEWPESEEEKIPAKIVAALQAQFGDETCFERTSVMRTGEGFGSEALWNSGPRTETVVVDEFAYLLRIDGHAYRDYLKTYDQFLLEKRAALLSYVSEFQFLKENRDVFGRMARYMERFEVEQGSVIDANTFGQLGKHGFFIVLEAGMLTKQRVIDFSGYDGEKVDVRGVDVQIPDGEETISVKTYRPKSLIPDPALFDYVPYAFTLVADEHVVAYKLKLKDVESVCLHSQMQRIRAALRDEPDNDQLIKNWIEKRQAMQWDLMKQKSVRLAMLKNQQSVRISPIGFPVPRMKVDVPGLLMDSLVK